MFMSAWCVGESRGSPAPMRRVPQNMVATEYADFAGSSPAALTTLHAVRGEKPAGWVLHFKTQNARNAEARYPVGVHSFSSGGWESRPASERIVIAVTTRAKTRRFTTGIREPVSGRGPVQDDSRVGVRPARTWAVQRWRFDSVVKWNAAALDFHPASAATEPASGGPRVCRPGWDSGRMAPTVGDVREVPGCKTSGVALAATTTNGKPCTIFRRGGIPCRLHSAADAQQPGPVGPNTSAGRASLLRPFDWALRHHPVLAVDDGESGIVGAKASCRRISRHGSRVPTPSGRPG